MGHLFAVIAFCGWAFAAVLLRQVTLPLPTIVCFGYAVGAGIMLASAPKGAIGVFAAFARKHPVRVGAQVLFYSTATGAYHWAIMLTTMSNAALTHSLQPLFTCLLFVPALRRTWPAGWTLASALLGFAGLYLALFDGLSASTSWAGIALGTLSAVAYSAGLMQMRFFTSQVEQRTLMGGMMGLSFCAMLPFAVAAGGTMPHWLGLGALLGYALICFAGANWLFFAASKRIPEAHLAILGYIEPVAAIGCAALFLNEPLTWNAVLGGVLVLGSGALLALDRASKTKPATEADPA